MKFERFGTGIAKGLAVTIKYLFRKPITTQYPEERLTTSRRIRGNELVWDRTKCTGCASCAKTCPQGVIRIVTRVNPATNKYDVEQIEIDTGYCIGCGLCVEVCPYNALYMGRAYECAKYQRGELVQRDDTLAESTERQASGYAHPEVAARLPQQTLLLEKDRKKK